MSVRDRDMKPRVALIIHAGTDKQRALWTGYADNLTRRIWAVEKAIENGHKPTDLSWLKH